MHSVTTISRKWNEEWINAKPTAILNYVSVASSLAGLLIESKTKMISNWRKVMATSQYEDQLQPYIDNNKMGDNYTAKLNQKTSMTDSQLIKFKNYIILEKDTMTMIQNALIEQLDQGSLIYAHPRYDGFPKRRSMEVRIGLNAIVLPSLNKGDRLNSIPLAWDYYMINNYNWTFLFPESYRMDENREMM